MADLALDTDGDIAIENGDASLVSGTDAILQHIRMRLLFVRGEWFADRREGVPYFESILRKAPDLNLVRSILREAIARTPGIASVPTLTLELDASTRALSVSFEAVAEDGAVIRSADYGAPFILSGGAT